MKILTAQEQLRKARAENAQLLAKNQQLEDALLELAQIISEVKHGEIIPTEDNE